MKKPVIFSLFDNPEFSMVIGESCNYEPGDLIVHTFPDEESCVQIRTDVKNREVIFVASLDRPNKKILPLIFAADTAKNLGAKKIGLVVPYLPYMRQDKQFNPGEGISAIYFAKLISHHFNWLLTIDPHLHRIKSLSEIYSIPTTVLHIIDPIVDWIKENVIQPLLIGPDSESEQWVSAVAEKANIPYVISDKIRTGDRTVKVSIKGLEKYQNHTPVLIDDIISTAKTMTTTIKHLHDNHMTPPVCIGIHAIFAENSYNDLKNSGASKIVSCNTIKHPSNAIDVTSLVIQALKDDCSG